MDLMDHIKKVFEERRSVTHGILLGVLKGGYVALKDDLEGSQIRVLWMNLRSIRGLARWDLSDFEQISSQSGRFTAGFSVPVRTPRGSS